MTLLSTGFGEGTLIITAALFVILLALVFYKNIVAFIFSVYKQVKEDTLFN